MNCIAYAHDTAVRPVLVIRFLEREERAGFDIVDEGVEGYVGCDVKVAVLCDGGVYVGFDKARDVVRADVLFGKLGEEEPLRVRKRLRTADGSGSGGIGMSFEATVCRSNSTPIYPRRSS